MSVSYAIGRSYFETRVMMATVLCRDISDEVYFNLNQGFKTSGVFS